MAISVRSASLSLIKQVEGLFYPWLMSPSFLSRQPDFSVVCVAGSPPDLFHTIRQMSTCGWSIKVRDQAIHCVGVLDRYVLYNFDGWQHSGLIDHAIGQVVVFSPHEEELFWSTAGLVRDIASKSIQKSCAVPIHGTAVDTGHGGLLLIGEKGSGKTTLMLELVRNGPFWLIDNDRPYLLRGDDGALSVLAGPPIVRIDMGSSSHLPWLNDRLRLTASDGTRRGRSKIVVSGIQAMSLVGALRVEPVELVGVILFELASGEDNPIVRPADSVEVVKSASDGLGDVWPNWMRLVDQDSLDKNLQQYLDCLARTRAWVIRQGTDVAATRRSVEEILTRIPTVGARLGER